ncbi:DUF4126 domain-containing protein [Streptomyces sp. NPDC050448]|uniref:DUF4126 domain-containing protein n=1 Tax=Streptomyces sp. NPDC050448 TaxID=3155404 RepID=UPI00342D9818
MANTPVVAVGRPDDLGWRQVTINDQPAGRVRSMGELRRLIRRAGLASGSDIRWIGEDCTNWPDRPWYRRIVGTLMAAGLLATACMLTVIGMKDAFGALTYSGRVTGIIFLLAAGLEIIAVLAAVDYWHKRRVAHSGMVILIGASVSLAVGLLMLIMLMIDGGRYTNYVPLWVIFTMLSVAALCILVRDRVWKTVPHPGRIAAGAIVSALLAVPNVTYTQIYIPYATSPILNSAAYFGKPSLNKGQTKMYLPVHLSVKNSGQIPVYVVGSIYWVHGWIPVAKRNPASRLIHDGEFVRPPGQSLNPGEEFSEDEVIEIHCPCENKYEKVDVQAELYAIRKDRMAIVGDYARSGENLDKLKEEGKDQDPRGPEGQQYFRYQTSISNSNEILNATRGRQRITLWYVKKHEWPYVYVVVEPPGERVNFDIWDPNRNKKAVDRYGLERVRSSMQQKPFVELMEMAKEQPSTSETPTPTTW